jgi:acyl carrier protein
MEINTVDNKVIFDDLINIVKPYCKTETDFASVANETRFIEDLGINSARLVDIVIDIEDKFNIAIEDEVADQILTIQDAIAVISEKMS